MAGTATDDLLDDVRAAYNGTEVEPPAETPAIEAPVEQAAETPQQTDGRDRDESGRFKASDKPRETLKLKDREPSASGKPTDAQPSAPAAPAANAAAPNLPPEIDKEGKHLDRIPPPVGWKGAAKVDWDRMPRNVREAVAAELNSVEAARAELAPLKELFDVNREFLVSQAGSVVEAQRQMMQFARMSVDNPVQLAEHILRARGLDPRAVFSGQPQQAAPQGQQPDTQAYIAQLVSQQLQPILGQFGQQQSQQLQSQIDAFAARQDRPYFNDVRVLMGQMMEGGHAKTMDEAYEMATRANPTIHAQLQAADREAAEKAKAAELAKARAASGASLRGSPIPGVTAGQASQHSSVHDDVRQAFADASGA